MVADRRDNSSAATNATLKIKTEPCVRVHTRIFTLGQLVYPSQDFCYHKRPLGFCWSYLRVVTNKIRDYLPFFKLSLSFIWRHTGRLPLTRPRPILTIIELLCHFRITKGMLAGGQLVSNFSSCVHASSDHLFFVANLDIFSSVPPPRTIIIFLTFPCITQQPRILQASSIPIHW
jgi:hypothetical protein